MEGRLANVLHESVDDIDTSFHEASSKVADPQRQPTTNREVNLETDRRERIADAVELHGRKLAEGIRLDPDGVFAENVREEETIPRPPL